ncbi:14841_t:CDS:1, partial [Acaulospora morrowiae]
MRANLLHLANVNESRRSRVNKKKIPSNQHILKETKNNDLLL